MSDNVNKDIQNAVKAAQGSGNTNGGSDSVNIPNPKILQHSWDQSRVNIPVPTKLQESKEKE